MSNPAYFKEQPHKSFVGRMEENKLSRMTDVLLAGGKMLRVHCATCKGPLFEYQGKIACAVCGEKAKPVEEEPKAEPKEKPEEKPQEKLLPEDKETKEK